MEFPRTSINRILDHVRDYPEDRHFASLAAEAVAELNPTRLEDGCNALASLADLLEQLHGGNLTGLIYHFRSRNECECPSGP